MSGVRWLRCGLRSSKHRAGITGTLRSRCRPLACCAGTCRSSTRSLLKPASYDTMETEVKLKDGSGTGYGLGVFVQRQAGRLVLEHSGEVGGFCG